VSFTSLKDVIFDPNYLAYKFNFNSECVEFLPISSELLRGHSFLRADALRLNAGSSMVSVPLSSLVELVEVEAQQLRMRPPRFIFHTAFCGSTFLSRCLEDEEATISLREPQLLLDAANAKRLNWNSNTTSLNHTHLPKLALILLQKHATDAKRLIIKPVNSINNIIPELLIETGPTKSLVLYTDARNFLLSTMNKGEAGRQTIRAMFDLIRCDFPHLAHLGLSDVIHMSDLKIIMTLWRLQIEQIEQVLAIQEALSQIKSLYAEDLIENPSTVVLKANQYLDTGVSEESLQALFASDLFSTDAKQPNKGFSLEQRNEEYSAIEAFFGEDIQKGFQWLVKNNPNVSLQPILTNTLEI